MAVTYTVSGRVVDLDGVPVPEVRVSVKQLADLTTGPTSKGTSTTDSNGKYLVSWQESAAPASPWDLFVEADNLNGTVIESRLITDPPSSVVVDVIFGTGSYLGRSEWDRIAGAIEEVLDGFAAKDVLPSRLEWVCRRADVFPTLAAMYIQAHRLSDGRSVKAVTCYACLRHGLPADLPGLLRAGRAGWEGALRAGWERRIIPLPDDGSSAAQDAEVATEVAALDELVVENAIYDSETGVNRRRILDTAGLEVNDQRTFTELWLAHEGTLAEFWEDATTALGSDKVADLQFTLQATTLVGNHLETLSQLQIQRNEANISSVRDLAAWDQSTWEDFLDGAGVGDPVEPPEVITGVDLAERRQKYARALRRLVEDAYPTDVLRHRLAAEVSAPAHTAELVGFFVNNPDFDITTTTIPTWVHANPTAFSYAVDSQQARADLEIVQRVYRVTPRLGRYETTKALLDNGITSAADIANYTREEFREAFSSVLPSEHHDSDKLAYRIWENSQRIHSSTLAAISYHALAKSGVAPLPVQNLGKYTFGGPDGGPENGLETLDAILGNLDYCACTHCRSVFSPVAYLADLLKFLDDRKAKLSFDDALAVLRERRPDIEHILLDCANTNTVLPQIDLVIELLERKFAQQLDGSSPQTTWSTEQLLAHPEHVLAGVYDNTLPAEEETKLNGYVHPWALPFSLPVLESRTYLAHLGLQREQLMRLLDDGTAPAPEAIAAEALGLSPEQFAIIADTWTASTDKREFWGFDPNDTEDDEWDGILRGDPEVEGHDPRELLRRGDYELDEIRELLDLTFIDPQTHVGPSWIEFQWSETCSLSDAEIINLDKPALDRLHRFTRLARATKLAPRMLNVLIEQVGGGVLDEDFLLELPRIIYLHERTRLDYDVLATWWSDRIDAQTYEDGPQSLYHQRFLAPELQASGFFQPTNQDGLALEGDDDPVLPITNLSEADLAVVLSATRLSAADYTMLMTLQVPAPDDHVFTAADKGKFNFRFFAELMRAASFMRAAKLSAEEFTILMTLLDDVGEDPFASPTQTWNVLEWLDSLRDSKLSLSEVAYLLRHDFADEHGADEAKVGRAFVELVRGLRTIADEVGELVDPDGKATQLNLATVILDENGVVDDADLAEVMKILANTSQLPTEQEKADLIDAYFGSFTDTTIAKAQLVTGPLGEVGGELGGELSDAPARYAWVLREFIGNSRRRTLLTDLAARELQIPPAAAGALLFDVLTDPGVIQDPLATPFLVDFASEEQITIGVDSSTHPDEFKAWARLSKAAMVVRSFTIDATQIKWYSDHSEWVDLNLLPLAPADTKTSIDKWIKLLQAMEVRKLFATADGHQRLEAADNLNDAVAVLVEATGWDAVQLGTVLDTAYLNLSTPSALGVPSQLIRVREFADASAQTGASLPSLWSWIHPSGTEFAVANEIKAAARAKYDAAEWAKIAPPLRDKLRVAQRDALVAANLAANPTLKNRDALSENLLIDVAISPCAKTSRIGQAISSVQLFIHRAFIRLEANSVEFKEEAGDLWSWMKNYRVWEANRKVFLYPENWIKPELRSDKTPQFQAFESALMQDTLDEYRVERALSGYLEALDTISNLEIVGIWSYLDQFGPPIDDVWVLGRTQNAPHEYHIRHRGGWQDWEPWEAVPLNIEGNNVALVMHENRLFLFWLLIHDGTGSEGASFDAVHLSIAWSERTQEGWSRVSISERSEAITKFSPKSTFRLQFWATGQLIRLLALEQYSSDDSFSDIRPTATFDYDTVSKRMLYSGSTFDPNAPNNAPYFFNGGFMRQTIAMQGNYVFCGQRYKKDPDDSGVSFVQPGFWAFLFYSHPENAEPALIHQADLWDLNPNTTSKFLPVVYDDRRRKYLLQPTQSLVGLGTDGADISPQKFGQFEITNILECTEPSGLTVLVPSPPSPKAQRIRDRLSSPVAFTIGGVPGQEPELAMLVGLKSFNIAGGNEEAVLQNAENDMSGNILWDDGNNVDSHVFWLKFEPLYHPYAHQLVHRVSRFGLAGIYGEEYFFRQLVTHDALTLDLDVNDELVWGGEPPMEEFDFNFGSAYGAYNWEIFYHAPTLIASKLTTDQRFEEAQNWLHKIFDPIRVVEGEEGPEKFWRIKPFYEQAQAIMQDQFEVMLGIGVTEGQKQVAIAKFEAQIEKWRKNPFDPHAIARIRPGTYQRALLMQYFDNLIAWADSLFRRDTIESINEALMLYMLVSQLLGERPREVPGPEGNAKSYQDLASEGLDELANAAVQLENWVVGSTEPAKLFDCVDEEFTNDKRHNVPLRFWYFCYPPNPKLLAYWDIVEDRLWKIRNCQNIDGLVRQLPLFQPPIDPALLVAAMAAGVDLASALAELDSGLPPYRFRYVWGRAQTITNELRSLGAALLSALEKRDAEELAVLRAGQEVSLLEAIRQVRLRRIDEAAAAIEALQSAQNVLHHRRGFYAGLIGQNAGDDRSAGEQGNLDKLEQARNRQIVAQAHRVVGGLLSWIPQWKVAATDPGMIFGGVQISASVMAGAEMFSAASAESSYQASKSLTNAQYDRRLKEWEFQRDSTEHEIERIKKDRAVAEIRLAIAQRELADHDLQVANAREIERFMHDKYTDQQLYDWMIGQLSTLYFQTYQLAFDLAKRAERAYRHELAIREQAQPIIKYGYWDSLRKGLLAGERLAHDLARLDVAYMDKDVREFELRKSISLAQLDPVQLKELQETGECSIEIPELLFDLDHPGHYLRRIRAVRLTIPAVVGPYTTLGATLQLLEHTTRVDNDHNNYTTIDDRFVIGYGGGQAIATSTAVADAGLFNLDFKDERYLPFEYAGAVSKWELRLPDPAKAPQFDYRTISDVIVHIDYTAREGGDDLRGAASDAALAALQGAGMTQVFVIDSAFPNEWEQFLAVPASGPQILTLPLTLQHFNYLAQRKGMEIEQIDFMLLLEPDVTAGGNLTLSMFGEDDLVLTQGSHGEPPTPNVYMSGSIGSLTEQPNTWTLLLADDAAPLNIKDGTRLDKTKVAGMLMMVHYVLT